MFDNLKKKLKGIFGKAKETVEEQKPPEAPPAEGELLKEIEAEEQKEAEKEAEEIKEEIVGKFEEKIEEPKAEDFAEKEKVPPLKTPLPKENFEAEPKINSLSEGGRRDSPPAGAGGRFHTPSLNEVPPKIALSSVSRSARDEVEDEHEEPLDEKAETVSIEIPKPQAEDRAPQAAIKPAEHKPSEAVGHLEKDIEEKKEGGVLKLFSKITHKELAEKDIAPVLWELEIALLENDVAKEVSEKLIYGVKESLLSKKAKRGSVEEIIKAALKKSVNEILGKDIPDLLKLVENKKEKPFVILFFGFNGTGKTMTIGKFAKMLKDNGFNVVMAAGDTFRAAAIEQLEVHANALGVPIIKQKKGADSAAVIFDAIKYAKAKNIDVVLADTAGRSHTNTNLMDELRKIVKVSKPDFKIFVGDSLTGNDAAEQAKLFSDAVGIDGSVLTKVDTDPKGGACLSVAYVTKQPILYLGNGQKYEDLIDFSAKWFLDKVF